jgi:hypothetical protein
VLDSVRERHPSTIGVAWRHFPDPAAHPHAAMLALAVEAATERGRGTGRARVRVIRAQYDTPTDEEQTMSTTTNPVAAPSVPRRTVATLTSYPAAERAVDWLSDQGFPVQHVTIVGTGLRSVEQVSGRVTTASAALAGAGQGAMLGLFWGLLFGLFFTIDTGSFFGVLAYGLVLGAVFGAILGAAAQYATRGRRNFDSAAHTGADRYEVQVDDGLALEAERVLARMPRD